MSEAGSFFAIKRVYDPPAPGDGVRVLVDRLWPRGLAREQAAIDEWMKDIAPSPALRVWFGHRPDRFAEFAGAYERELAEDPVRPGPGRPAAGHGGFGARHPAVRRQGLRP